MAPQPSHLNILEPALAGSLSPRSWRFPGGLPRDSLRDRKSRIFSNMMKAADMSRFSRIRQETCIRLTVFSNVAGHVRQLSHSKILEPALAFSSLLLGAGVIVRVCELDRALRLIAKLEVEDLLQHDESCGHVAITDVKKRV